MDNNSKMRAVLTATAALTKEQCERIVQDCLELPKQEGEVGHRDSLNYTPNIRSSTVRWADSIPSVKDLVEQHIYNANRLLYGFDIDGVYQIQFTEYLAENSGHYTWHDDAFGDTEGPLDRKLSLSIQLSAPSEYEGGRLQFAMDEGVSDSSTGQGDVIIFPSFRRHRVTPVTKGKRYALVAWAEGPKWR